MEALNAGRSYIADVPTVEVLSAVKAGPYGRATSDYAVLAECDIVSSCGPTPPSKTSDPDLPQVWWPDSSCHQPRQLRLELGAQ